MSQPSVSSLDFLPRCASVPRCTEVTAELCAQKEMERSEMEKFNLVCPHMRNCRIIALNIVSAAVNSFESFCKATFIDCDTASSANDQQCRVIESLLRHSGLFLVLGCLALMSQTNFGNMSDLISFELIR